LWTGVCSCDGGSHNPWAALIEQIQSKDTFCVFVASCVCRCGRCEDSWNDVITDPVLAKSVSNRLAWARSVYDCRPLRVPNLDTKAVGYRWQSRFELFVAATHPDDRAVHVVIDLNGGLGKSQFCKYMLAKYTTLLGCADNSTATCSLYNPKTRVALFDVKRALSSKIDWSIIESVKDGLMVQTKYEVMVKVCCFTRLLISSSCISVCVFVDQHTWDFTRICIHEPLPRFQ